MYIEQTYNIKSAKDYVGFNPARYVPNTNPENMNPIQIITYKRTYARDNEAWSDICLRVSKGVVANLVEYKFIDISESSIFCELYFNAMWDLKMSPPGRGLKYMGTETPSKKGAGVLVNCSFYSTKDGVSENLQHLGDMLALGCGVGFDNLGKGSYVYKPKRSTEVHYLDDTREGIIGAYGIVLDAFLKPHRSLPIFDYSLIRGKGEKLVTMGGTASGPEPYKLCITSMIKILSELIGNKLTGKAINQLACVIARSIVSGGVRRSALINLDNSDDEEYLNLKSNNPDLVNEYLWASNNSIRVFNENDIDKLVEANVNGGFGDPGAYIVDNLKYWDSKEHIRHLCGLPFEVDTGIGPNPCAEINLEDGEVCNINEQNLAAINSEDEFANLLTLGYMYCKVITCFPYSIRKTDKIVKRNRRIGLGVTGVVDALAIHGKQKLTEWLNVGYAWLTHIDKVFSAKLGIPTSIRLSTVKPGGTVPLVLGVSSGASANQSEYMIRRIGVNENDPVLTAIVDAGYRIEKSVYYPNTYVVEVPVYKKGADKVSKRNQSFRDQIELVSWLQKEWADNSVSCTLNYRKDEIPYLAETIKEFLPELKTFSLLPVIDAETKYVQLPEEPITREQYIEYTKNLKRLNIGSMVKDESGRYCDSDGCEIKQIIQKE